MDMIKLKSQHGISGSYRIKKFKKGTRELIWQSDLINNLVMESATTGTGSVAKALEDGLSIQITRAAIGTGTTTPADADIDLVTPVLTDIEPIMYTRVTNVLTIEFFMPDGELSNGTYNEFAIYTGATWAGRAIFARSIISPSYSKGTGEDTQIAYQITVNN